MILQLLEIHYKHTTHLKLGILFHEWESLNIVTSNVQIHTILLVSGFIWCPIISVPLLWCLPTVKQSVINSQTFCRGSLWPYNPFQHFSNVLTCISHLSPPMPLLPKLTHALVLCLTVIMNKTHQLVDVILGMNERNNNGSAGRKHKEGVHKEYTGHVIACLYLLIWRVVFVQDLHKSLLHLEYSYAS